MLSPDQLDRLEEQRNRATTTILIGWMLIVFGAVFAIFTEWDAREGTNMMKLMFAAEVLLGLIILAIGATQRLLILRRMDLEHTKDFEAREGAAKSMEDGAGHHAA
jgi:MFS-type transporter involved in bile tolerance (Atg22 family)